MSAGSSIWRCCVGPVGRKRAPSSREEPVCAANGRSFKESPQPSAKWHRQGKEACLPQLGVVEVVVVEQDVAPGVDEHTIGTTG